MIAIPSLTTGVGARPSTGAPETPEPVGSLEDALTAVRRLAALGYSRLHLADPELPHFAVPGREEARELLRHAPLQVQAEVRDRDERTMSEFLAIGAEWIVLPVGDLDDASNLAEIASVLPGRVILDLEASRPLRGDPRRWTRSFDLIAALEPFQFGGLVVAAPNAGTAPTLATLAIIEQLVGASPWPVQVRCAPATIQALRNLEDRGVAGALLVTSAGIDAIDPRLIAEEFAA